MARTTKTNKGGKIGTDPNSIDTGTSGSAPVISSNGGGSSASLNVVENTAVVTTVAATDADSGSTLAYSIIGGADATKFVIDAATGVLKFVAPPNYETPGDVGADNIYDVTVQVSDGVLTDSQAISIKVTNANEAPVIGSNGGGASAAVNIAENTGFVTTVKATDADAGAALAYSIAGGVDAAKFTINSSTGALNFVSPPNFEMPTDSGANNVYDVTVRVSDGTLVDTQAISVTVTNVNEAPAIVSNGAGSTAAVSVAENSSAVTTVAASDADAGAQLTYSIAGGADASQFTIDATTGALKFAAAPDHEKPTDSGADNTYDVIVKVSDGNLFDTQALSVTVANVAEATDSVVGSGTSSTSGSGFTILVSNAAELLAALQNAKGGETIALNAGDYGALKLWSGAGIPASYSGQVTIVSADPTHPATLTGLGATGVGNIKFDNINFDYTAVSGTPTFNAPFCIKASTNIEIVNCRFDGDLATGLGATIDGYGTGKGLTIDGCSGVTVANNVFTDWNRAAVFSNTSDLTVSGNEVSRNSSDGFNFANVDNVLIQANYLHDFLAAPDSTSHPDMIQFWTSGTTSPSTNITIVDNYLDAGSGITTQSIFMRNEVVDTGAAGAEMFYQNVTISNNVIVNRHVHGITVGETAGLVIDNNTILQKSTISEDGTISVPKINVALASTGVTISDNVVPSLSASMTGPGAGWDVHNNVVAQRDLPHESSYIGNLYSDALDLTSATLDDYQVIAGSYIDNVKAGSTLSSILSHETLGGYIVAHENNAAGYMVQSFDASNVFSKGTRVDLTGATVVWDFGDGTVGSGTTADHVYASAGVYEATAHITLASGKTLSIDKTLVVASDNLLDVDFDKSAADLSPTANAVDLGVATFEAGADGNAIRLNGGVVKYDAGVDFFGNSEFTLLADFKKDAATTSTGGRLVYFSGVFVVSIGADGLDVSLCSDAGGATLKAASVGINDADWHRLALTYSGDAGTAALYLDGQLVASASGIAGIQQSCLSSADLYLGGPFGGSFVGLIDNVHYVRDAMTPAEIASADPVAAWSSAAINSTPAVADYVADLATAATSVSANDTSTSFSLL